MLVSVLAACSGTMRNAQATVRAFAHFRAEVGMLVIRVVWGLGFRV